MNYFLIKLAFDTAVHFGPSETAQSLSTSEDHLHADTFFSALCHTALQIGGVDCLNRLCDWAREGSLLFSDTMPWSGDSCYLPKPMILSDHRKELPARQAKAMKKLNWIPVDSISRFSASLHGDGIYDPGQYATEFGIQAEATRVKARINPDSSPDAVPYQVGLFQFKEECGIYILAAVKTDEQEDVLTRLVNALGMSGVGGKISSGLGKFHIEDQILLNEPFDAQTKWFYQALTDRESPQLLLTASLPREDELKQALQGASYQVVRRGGFVFSETYSESPMKKKTQYFIKAGSVFKKRFSGDLYTVGKQGSHPVFRYGKPLFLGVKL